MLSIVHIVGSSLARDSNQVNQLMQTSFKGLFCSGPGIAFGSDGHQANASSSFGK